MLSLSRTRATCCQKWRAPASRREPLKRRRAAPVGATGRRRKQDGGVIWASRCRLTLLASKVSAVSDLRLLVVKIFFVQDRARSGFGPRRRGRYGGCRGPVALAAIPESLLFVYASPCNRLLHARCPCRPRQHEELTRCLLWAV